MNYWCLLFKRDGWWQCECVLVLKCTLYRYWSSATNACVPQSKRIIYLVKNKVRKWHVTRHLHTLLIDIYHMLFDWMQSLRNIVQDFTCMSMDFFSLISWTTPDNNTKLDYGKRYVAKNIGRDHFADSTFMLWKWKNRVFANSIAVIPRSLNSTVSWNACARIWNRTVLLRLFLLNNSLTLI